MSIGRIYAFITCTRVMWEEDEDGNTYEDAVEEHGWIDRSWSPYVLHDSRNDVCPVVGIEEDDDSELIFDEITDALGWLEGGFENNGDGTFYSAESYQPYTEPWNYSYALHFTRKFYNPEFGYIEENFDPMSIPSVKEWADGLK